MSELHLPSRAEAAVDARSREVSALVLGPLVVEDGGRSVPVTGSLRRRLLALLIARVGRMAPVEAIVDALWGDQPPPSAAKTVQSHIVRLRQSFVGLPFDLIETVPGGYRLALSPRAVDAHRFEAMVTDGRELLADGAAAAAAERLQAALGLWRGPAYVEFTEAEFAASIAVHLEELRIAAIEDLAECQLEVGAARCAVASLERLVRDSPGRERAWGLLMRALYASGRRNDALCAYHRARHALADEFGLDAGPQLRAIEHQILDDDPALSVAGRELREPLPAAGGAEEVVIDEVLELVAARARRDGLHSATWAGRQPYRALASYGPHDAELFVGRERLVAELVARVLDRQFVVLTGASGSGKSSLVNAGLIPLARSGRLPGGAPWRTAVVVPGPDPVAALDAVAGLREPGAQLLVVDQFEEALAAGPGAIEAFATRLTELAADPERDVHVVLAVRVDQLVALRAVPPLAVFLASAPVVVGPPNEQELRRIIVEPARRTEVEVEPALVDRLMADVEGCDGALPLVSAVMAELWEHREGAVLCVRQYEAIGSIAASVERLGEAAVGQVGHDLEPMRRMLLALADVSDDGVWTRKRLAVTDVPASQVDALAALVGTRLVALGETTVEIVHEVTFSAWPRLAAWLETARGDRIMEHDVRTAARAWDAQGRTDDGVYRGAHLDAAVLWFERCDAAQPRIVRQFLARSIVRRDAEVEATASRLATQARDSLRLRRLLGGAAGLLLVGVAAAAGLARRPSG